MTQKSSPKFTADPIRLFKRRPDVPIQIVALQIRTIEQGRSFELRKDAGVDLEKQSDFQASAAHGNGPTCARFNGATECAGMSGVFSFGAVDGGRAVQSEDAALH